MSTVVFWSPIQGASGSTSLAAAVSVAIANIYRGRMLITHLDQGKSSIEAGFPVREHKMDDPSLHINEGGWGALERLSARGTLSKDNICNYTVPLLENTLDMLEGAMTTVAHKGIISPGLVRSVLDTAEQYYDLTIVDAGSSREWNFVQQEAIQKAKLVVVTLNQNVRELEAYFETNKDYNLRPLLITLGKYDASSHTTVTNIRRRFAYKGTIYPIPYSTEFMDDWNRRDLLGHVQRNVRTDQRRPSKKDWALCLQSLVKSILEKADLDIRPKALERGA